MKTWGCGHANDYGNGSLCVDCYMKAAKAGDPLLQVKKLGRPKGTKLSEAARKKISDAVKARWKFQKEVEAREKGLI